MALADHMDKAYAALRSLFSYWKSVLLIFIVAVTAGAVIPVTGTPTRYSCEARVTVSAASVASAEELEAAMAFGTQYVSSLANLPVSQDVLEAVIAHLDLPFNAEELKSEIAVRIPSGAAAVAVTVTDTDSAIAYEIALATVRESVKRFEQFMPIGTSAGSPIRIDYYAGVPTVVPSPSASRSKLILFGVALGLVAGLLQAAVRKGWKDAATRDAAGESYPKRSQLAVADSLTRASQLLSLAADEIAIPSAGVTS